MTSSTACSTPRHSRRAGSSINPRAKTAITAADIHAILAGTAAPTDPAAIEVRAAGRGWPAELLAKFGGDLRPAAVLIPLIDRDDGMTVLLTERARDLKHHPGQISFPGGRMEAHDPDLRATALRETYEEVGIRPEQVEVAGYLAPMPTVTGYAVTAIVGVVAPDIELALDRTEVAQAFEVPFDFLMDDDNQRHTTRRFEGVDMPLIEFRYGPRRIWGATAAMIVMLHRILSENRTL